MGLFTWTKPHVDPTMGDPAYGQLVGAAAAGKWPAIRDFLTRQTDPRDASFYVRAVSQTAGSEDWLRQAAQTDSSPLARMVYATRLLDLTKNFLARGEQWPPIEDTHRWNQEAEQLLQSVVAQEPDNVTAWWLLARASRRERLGQDETARRFTEADPISMGVIES